VLILGLAVFVLQGSAQTGHCASGYRVNFLYKGMNAICCEESETLPVKTVYLRFFHSERNEESPAAVIQICIGASGFVLLYRTSLRWECSETVLERYSLQNITSNVTLTCTTRMVTRHSYTWNARVEVEWSSFGDIRAWTAQLQSNHFRSPLYLVWILFKGQQTTRKVYILRGLTLGDEEIRNLYGRRSQLLRCLPS